MPAMACRRRWSLSFVCLAVLLFAADCRFPEASSTPATREARRQREREYQQRLEAWRRDSVILDSIAATVPIDELVRALRKQNAPSEDPLRVLHEVECAEGRIQRAYGLRVLEPVVWRAWREVWPTEEARRKAMRRFRASLPNYYFLDT